MGVRQKNISGIFRRFLFSFLLAGAATILVLGVVVQILTIKAVIHPANYDEQQLEQKREEIQTTEKVLRFLKSKKSWRRSEECGIH